MIPMDEPRSVDTQDRAKTIQRMHSRVLDPALLESRDAREGEVTSPRETLLGQANGDSCLADSPAHAFGHADEDSTNVISRQERTHVILSEGPFTCTQESMTYTDPKELQKALHKGMAKLARRVKNMREVLGWSQQELAYRAGLSVSAVQKLEQGTKNPRVSSVAAVAMALDTTLPYLVFGEIHTPEMGENIDFAGEMVKRYRFPPAKEAFVLERIGAYQFSTGETPDSIQAAIHMAAREYDIHNSNAVPFEPPEKITLPPGMQRREPLRKGSKD